MAPENELQPSETPTQAAPPRKRASRRATTSAGSPAPSPVEAPPADPHEALGTPDIAIEAGDVAAAAAIADGDGTDEVSAPKATRARTAKTTKAAKSAPKKTAKRAPRRAAAPAAAPSQEPAAETDVVQPDAIEPDAGASTDLPMPLADAIELAAGTQEDIPSALTVVTADEILAGLEAGMSSADAATGAGAHDTGSDDADNTDADGSDNTDADGSDNTDADGSDNTDADGSDNTDADDADNTDADGSDNTDADDADNTDGDDTATPMEEARPTVASFGLLFQAPDPTTARRSRRASAPSMTPSARADELDGSDAPDSATLAADGDDHTQGLEDEPTSSSGRSRSRRTRGRRADDRGAHEVLDEMPQQPGTSEGSRGQDGDDRTPGTATPDVEDTDELDGQPRRRRSRGGRGRKRSTETADALDAHDTNDADDTEQADVTDDDGDSSSRRRRRRRRAGGADVTDTPGVVTRVRQPRRSESATGIKGSTRLEAKRQRRREGREAGRRRTIITEAEFLARREAVDRSMVVRVKDGRTQIAVLEDRVLVEHYVSQETSTVSTSIAGNIYLGRVQNVLPSMEAAFVDIGRGRNAVLYAGEVNWDAAGLDNGQARRIENAHKQGETVLVQATKDPIGHKGARLTSQISLPGRYLVFVPDGSMTGISRKLPDTERARLKKILREVMPAGAGVIVRTAAEGASEEELRADVARLTGLWDDIQKKASARSTHAPALLHGEPDLTVRVVRDVFNEDFSRLVVSGEQAWSSIKPYIDAVAPDLADRVTEWTDDEDVFAAHRIDEQLAKAMDRKVFLPSGGSLVIDRTEAMTVVDVNTGKFTGAGGNLEETVTKNNLEAAEEVVRQLRLRDIGGIIVVDFIDMVLESNRDLVLRRLVECLGRDRTRHQVAEVTSLGLVQMTRKRVGTGLIESFSEVCEHCNGRGLLIHDTPIGTGHIEEEPERRSARVGRATRSSARTESHGMQARATDGRGGDGRGAEARGADAGRERAEEVRSGPTPAQIAAAAHAAAQAAAARSSQATPDELASEGEVAAAIEQAVTAALDQQQQSQEPAPTRRGRRGSRRAVSAPAGAPAVSAPSMPAIASTFAPPSTSASDSTEAGSAPVEETVTEPTAPTQVRAAEAPQVEARQERQAAAPRVRRARRPRVVSPAGPPASEATASEATPAEPVSSEAATGDE